LNNVQIFLAPRFILCHKAFEAKEGRMKQIGLGAAALMVLMLATGCDRMQKAARDLAGEDGDDGHPPATASHATGAHVSGSASASAAVSSSSVAVIDPPDTQVGDWHIAMTAACADGKAQHIAHFDINGDGIPDTVCWHVIRSKTYGDYAEIDARVKAGDHEQSAYILLPSHRSGRDALAGVDHLTVKQTLWAQKDIDRMRWGSDHRVSLTIEDGDSDPFWLFWPKDAVGDEVDFHLERD
jgi:hypothetical protein